MDDEDLHLQSKQFLIARIHQLEHERDELHKDIEQLCMQQAGPSYLGVATRMYFQRTAGLEQEIENLKNRLAACTRENQNLQEELSEAYNIKTQLADLHGAEVSKNIEAEKQVKFFQSSVASAFAERDNAIMEGEKAKEKEELLSRELNKFQKRIEAITSELLEEKKLTAAMQIDQDTWEKQMESFRKVIDKFYGIKQQSLSVSEVTSWEDKCECLLHDSAEMWSFHHQEKTSTSKYISALEQEVESLRKSVDNLQNNLQMGLEIEKHLKKKVRILAKEKFLLQEKIDKGLASLLKYHSKHRIEVVSFLDEGISLLISTIREVEEKIRELELSWEQNPKAPKAEDMGPSPDESECRDVHVNNDSSTDSTAQRSDPDLPTTIAVQKGDASEALAQALHEKVAALLLLSQEEERHLLGRNLNVALQRKIEELQRNLLQVTNEKVKALMELAQLKQEYQLLQEKINQEMQQGKPYAESGEKGVIRERDGKLKNLLKKTYLKNWVGNMDFERYNAETNLKYEGNLNQRKSNMDFARMKIENAALKESLESMEHLTSSIRKLRLTLSKMKESGTFEGTDSSLSKAVADIIAEAKLVKTALSSSLPVSWSAEADLASHVDNFEAAVNVVAGSSNEKVDFVSAAGYEMVELLIFAAETWKECLIELKDH